MKTFICSIVMALVLTMVFAGGGRESGESLLVTAEWLEDNLDRVIVVDYGRSYEDFQKGHIPGAVYLDRSIFYDERNGIAGMLPDPEDIGAELGARGIDNRTTVVMYDSGNNLWASRAFWGFEVLGHRKVRLLDGGFAAWEELSYPVRMADEHRQAATFRVRFQPELIVDSAEILANYGNEDFVVLDTRSQDEYEGSDVRANRGGHIPGAVHIDWIKNIDADGRFETAGTLATIYDDTIDRNSRIATHCQTGVRGAHSYFALRLLGYKNVALYDGSWVEWGNRDDTPIALP